VRVHLVGIGGAGMSALANIYLEQGHEVTGSDMTSSYVTARLAERGARVAIGHRAENVPAADLVVVSTAIKDANPELQAARERGLPVMRRGAAAAALCKGRRQVAIAGSHGKTTTTTWVAELLASRDPLVINGGRLPGSLYNSRLGHGPLAVIEADESDGSYLELEPHIGVVTNVDLEHVTRYHDLDAMIEDFGRFASLSSVLVGCADDPGAVRVMEAAPGEVVTYGFSPADVHGSGYVGADGVCTFTVTTAAEEGELRLQAPGMHNARNALAVVAVGERLGIGLEESLAALERAHLPGRRLELVAEVRGVRVYDDYGHHPTEVATTLRAAREMCHGRLICAFQPYRASRLQGLLEEFARAFTDADEVVLVPIAPPDDVPILGVDHQLLADAIHRADPERSVQLLDAVDDVPAYVLPRLREGDAVICMGIGDIYRAAYIMASEAGAPLPAL